MRHLLAIEGLPRVEIEALLARADAFREGRAIERRRGSLQGKRIAIVGDVLHSRVARSNIYCLHTLGAEVVLCGPATLLPAEVARLGAQVTTELDVALEGVDAVMMLRVQRERQTE